MVVKKSLLFVFAALLLAACSTNSPRGFERVVKDVEQNGAEYTQKDWDKADARFEKFCEKYDQYELRQMNREEQREVGRLIARYTKARTMHAAKGLGELLNAGSALVSGFVDELDSDMVDDFDEDDLDEFDKLLEDLLNE